MKLARVIVFGTLFFSSIIFIAIFSSKDNPDILKSGSVLSAIILSVATFISGTNDALSLVDRFKKRDAQAEQRQKMEDKKIPEEQDENIIVNKETDKNITKIALWGPSGSGKTWLIRAFNRSLLEQDDPDFYYQLWEDNLLNVIRPDLEPPQVSSTTTSTDKNWIFIRKPKSQFDPSYAIQVSAFRHVLNIQDSSGESNLSDPIFLRTLNTSDAIFLFFNLPSSQEKISEDIFMSYLYKLEEIAVQHQRKGRKNYIAICLSKYDLAELKREPWELLYVLFGEQVYERVQEIKKLPNIDLEVFLISSAGYISSGGKVVPNLVPQTGEILNPNRWQPYNVEQPFFWLFENVERARLSNIRNPLDNILGFAEERKKYYIPYSPIKKDTKGI